MNELFEQLSRPFEPQHLSWKPGSTTKDGTKVMALAYADLRAYQERLDDVCGMEWSCRFVPWEGNRIICELTINGVTRSSTGEADAQDEKNNMAGSVSEAMAFKRACAAFGLGRFLYSLPATWVDFDAQAKRISKTGQAELDKRYRDWYNRMLAASAKRSPDPDDNDRPTIDPATGEILGSDDIDNPWNDDAPAPASEKAKTLSQAQLNRIHALGTELHPAKGEWNRERPRYVEWITKGAVTSSKQLQPGEADVLVAAMERKLKTQQAAEMQSTGQPAMAAAA